MEGWLPTCLPSQTIVSQKGVDGGGTAVQIRAWNTPPLPQERAYFLVPPTRDGPILN